jgi:acyl-CoA synthetase (AMP-forming)/AMP-acid ligase II
MAGKTLISEKMVAKYYKENLWANRTFLDYANESIKACPGKDLIVTEEGRMTFGEVNEKANNVAFQLRQLGVKEGDVISFQLPNWPETFVIYLAISKLGAVANPIVPIYQDREVKYILWDTHAVAMVIPGYFRKFDYAQMMNRLSPELPDLKTVIVVREAAPKGGMISYESMVNNRAPMNVQPQNVSPDDIRLINYTSGTTADPKGVQHTHNTLIAIQKAGMAFFDLREDDVWLTPAPLTHIQGLLFGLELAFILKNKVVTFSTWDPEKAIDMIEKEGITCSIGTTTFLRDMVDAATKRNYRGKPLRIYLCGGAEVPPELIVRAWDYLGWHAMRCYGSTEAPMVTWGINEYGTKDKGANTDGRVFRYEVKIVNAERKELALGEVGEIKVQGPKMFIGYTKPDLHKDSYDEDGWFYTGDLGRLDSEGYLEITGRKKDIIIRGGENISPKEIEDLLHLHPSVAEVAVVAMPDIRMGEKVCAYVVLRERKGLSFVEMVDFLIRQDLSRRKIPERLEIIDKFPRTPAGKIQKNTLRKDIANKLGLPPVRI